MAPGGFCPREFAHGNTAVTERPVGHLAFCCLDHTGQLPDPRINPRTFTPTLSGRTGPDAKLVILPENRDPKPWLSFFG
jgi:hypothetical protein